MTSPSDLTGKRAIVFGVASEDSIAWAIAKELAAHGAKVTMGYQKRFLSRVMQLFKDTEWIEAWHECDVTQEDSVQSFFQEASGMFDMMVHCIAFAPGEALANEITETKDEDFATALNISAYSLVRLTKYVTPKMNEGGSIVSLTYLGADRTVPGYRVMGTAKAALQQLTRELAAVVGPQKGIRVNTISAGPIRTLAASGVPGFDNILDWMKHSAPLQRNVSQEDVGRAAHFFLSDMSSGVTGQMLYVDCGYSSVGVPPNLDSITLPGQQPAQGPTESMTANPSAPQIKFG